MLSFMLMLLLIILEVKAWVVPLWILFGFFGTSGILPYAVLSQSFPAQLSARVNTALNVLVFVAAFSAQWGIGAVIEQWPMTSGGGYAPAGYRAAFALMLILQILCATWYALSGWFMRKRGRA
jgi:hypothetical protein